MNRAIFTFIGIVLISMLFLSCEKEEDKNPAPPEMHGDWHTIASQNISTGTYNQYEYVSILISDDDNGKYFHEYHKNNNQWEQDSEGDINWKDKGEAKQLELFRSYDEDPWKLNISVLKENYFIATLSWAGNDERWTFVKDNPYTIYGFVTYQQQPVENAVVFLEESEGTALKDTTLDCGLFWFSNLTTTEPQTLTIKKLGFNDYSASVKAQDWTLTIANAISLREGSSSLSKATISGMVYDKSTGMPLSYVNVGYGNAYMEYTLTDLDGNYSLEVPAGKITLEASLSDYLSAHKPLDAEAGQTYDIDFYITQAINISGKAIDQTGSPISEATITLYNENDAIVGSMLTNSNGDYNFDQIPAGVYKIVIDITGYAFEKDEINVDITESITDMNFEGTDISAKPTAPDNIDASDNTHDDFIRLSWSSVTNADEYQVYRSNSAFGTYESVSLWITDTIFDDGSIPDDNTYYYKVKARNSNGESTYSSHTPGSAITGGSSGPTDPFFYVYGIYLRGRVSISEYLSVETSKYDPLWRYIYENPEGTMRNAEMEYKPSYTPTMPYTLTDTIYYLGFTDTCGAVVNGTIQDEHDVQTDSYNVTTYTGTLNFTGDSEVATAIFNVEETMTIHGDGSWTMSYGGTLIIDGTTYNAADYLEDINGG